MLTETEKDAARRAQWFAENTWGKRVDGKDLL